MLNIREIQESYILGKVVAWDTPYNSAATVPDSQLTGVSTSGYYFNRATHPYLKNFETIIKMGPDSSRWTIEPYSATTTYVKEQIVEEGGFIYESLANGNTGNTPSSSPTEWLPTNVLSQYLKRTMRGSLETVLQNEVCRNPLVSNEYLYRLGRPQEDIDPNESKWVGIRINPLSSNHLSYVINQIGLQFTGTQNVEVFLYNQNNLVTSVNLTSDGNNFKFFDVDMNIDPSEKGAWYIFYDQTGLTEQSVGSNQTIHSCFDPYFSIVGFSVDPGTDLNTIDQSDFEYGTTFGLNLNLSIAPDLTNFIKQHPNLIAEAWQLQTATDILWDFLGNTNVRSNQNQRNIDREEVKFQLIDTKGRTLAKRLTHAMKKLSNSLDQVGKTDTAFRANPEDYYESSTV